jgi:hypothetical protein
VEVDPLRVGAVPMSYSPQTDGAPDPGEVVWTWVPFEENDGRGKDRPVLVVAVESAGTYRAVRAGRGPAASALRLALATGLRIVESAATSYADLRQPLEAGGRGSMVSRGGRPRGSRQPRG